MENDLFAPTFLFKLFEAAEIPKKDIARRLGVSKTLITLWSQAKRSISWTHYEALMDYAFDPATIWKIAQRLKSQGSIPGLMPLNELTSQFLIFKVIHLTSYRANRIYDAITTLTHELAKCTSGTPATWDFPKIQALNARLTAYLKDAPTLAMPLDPRLDKALRTLRDALGDSYYEEEAHATADTYRRTPGQSDDR